MEARKTLDSSSSSSSSSSTPSSSLSRSSDPFGFDDSPANLSLKPGIFNSVFPPASTILGRTSLRSDALGSLRKHELTAQIGDARHAYADGTGQSKVSKNHTDTNKERSSIYSDEAEHPCFLSSSLYYGGRDAFVPPSNTESSGTTKTNHQHGKDGEEDGVNGSNMASRGNWWQGSLYY